MDSEILEKMNIDNMNFNTIQPEGTIKLQIENFSTFYGQVQSNQVFIRNIPWNIMIKTDNNSKGLVEFFIQCNVDCQKYWCCTANLKFRLISNQKPAYEKIIRNHLFHNKENDWGFKNFILVSQIQDPSNEYSFNDVVTFEAIIEADAPHGDLWNSKLFAGFVGLKNQGATCYMNSLLQILFFTNEFREAIYFMPTEFDFVSKSFPLALQRIFYDLQFNEESVCTKNLTSSFGWKTFDILKQHDVQEFLRIILDKVENAMHNTVLEKVIPNLFEGKMLSYVRCKNVPYESKKIETFYDIQLNVKGFANVEESFRNYVKSEVLDENNKFNAAEYGFQTAEKGVSFISFPPILHLHLMRYHYDQKYELTTKCNDRFEFNDKIDLRDFLDNDKSEISSTYVLQSVLVHSGNYSGGHYLVYINPKCDDNWFKFDDEIVYRCKKYEAITNNFGGNTNHNSNAYMLVYIREIDIPKILKDLPQENIPNELILKIYEDKRIEKFNEMYNSNDIIKFEILIDEDIESNPMSNFFTFTGFNLKKFYLHKDIKYLEFYEFFENVFHMPKKSLLFFYFDYIYETFNCIEPLNKDNYQLNISIIFEYKINLTIFLHRLSPDEYKNFELFKTLDHKLLIIKEYDTIENNLNVVDVKLYSKLTKFLELYPDSNEDTNIYYTNENRHLIKVVEKNRTIEHLRDGDTVFIENKTFISVNDDNYMDFENFYQNIFHRMDITFQSFEQSSSERLTIKFSENTKFVDVINNVATIIKVEPKSLIFYKYSNGTTFKIHKRFYDQTLIQIFKTYNSQNEYIILYEMEPIHNLITVKVVWIDSELGANDVTIRKELSIQLKPYESVGDLLTLVAKAVNVTYRIRLVCVQNDRMSILRNELKALSIHQLHANFFAEEIPIDQLSLCSDEFLLPIMFVLPNAVHGIPFFIKYKNNADLSLEDVIEKIKDKINFNAEKFKNYEYQINFSKSIKKIKNVNFLGSVSGFDGYISFVLHPKENCGKSTYVN